MLCFAISPWINFFSLQAKLCQKIADSMSEDQSMFSIICRGPAVIEAGRTCNTLNTLYSQS